VKAYKDRDHTASKAAKHARLENERNNQAIRAAEHRTLVAARGKKRGKVKASTKEEE
jgi:hypothetical protein